MPPDTLYKYLHPDRIDVLQNLRIRFTQVSALNDPFESLPGIMKGARDFYLQEFNSRVESEISKLALSSESKRKQHRRLRKKDFNKFFKHYTDQKWLLTRTQYVQHMSDNIMGCLSLSGIPTNILMWSHYCQHHKGYVLGFDAKHEYFGLSVCPVVYSDVRPVHNPLKHENPGDIFYTKSKDWSYEQEFRKYLHFAEPIQTSYAKNLVPFHNPELHTGPNQEIKLFPFPKGAIKCIILGWKSPPELEQTLRDALQHHAIGHVPVYRATPSPTKYEMELQLA